MATTAATLASRRVRARQLGDSGTYANGAYLQRQFYRNVAPASTWPPVSSQTGIHLQRSDTQNSGALTNPGLSSLSHGAFRQGDLIRQVPLVYADQTSAKVECAICLGTLELDAPLRVPSCGHKFHAKCLRHWYERGSPCCPVCRHQTVRQTALSPDAQPPQGWGSRYCGANGAALEQRIGSRSQSRWAQLLCFLGQPSRPAAQVARAPWPFLDAT